jgi:hypothetical protein
MSRVKVTITMSVDGFVAGPRPGVTPIRYRREADDHPGPTGKGRS